MQGFTGYSGCLAQQQAALWDMEGFTGYFGVGVFILSVTRLFTMDTVSWDTQHHPGWSPTLEYP